MGENENSEGTFPSPIFQDRKLLFYEIFWFSKYKREKNDIFENFWVIFTTFAIFEADFLPDPSISDKNEIV